MSCTHTHIRITTLNIGSFSCYMNWVYMYRPLRQGESPPAPLRYIVQEVPEHKLKELHVHVAVIAGLTLTVCHRTFSGQFRHLSNQFHYLTGQICIGNNIDQTYLLENVQTRCLTYYKPCDSCGMYNVRTLLTLVLRMRSWGVASTLAGASES